ncbi:site-specific DNA-methyltransferase [Patescibacteria group bacterium]|nr:site-specific DNA-methyltransferase [Patescibacteria group bacterium]
MIKPYYQDKWVKIFLGDCREVLPQLDIKVDSTITDLPYGNNTEYDNYLDTKENLGNLIKTTLPIVRDKSARVLITCGVGNLWLYPEPDWTLLWVSNAGIGSGKWGFCCWQPILAYGNDPYLANKLGRRPDVIFSNEQASDNEHPCAKPISLWKQIVTRASLPGSIILDPFMGSGTTLEAAKALNRKSIGVEISEKYCEIAAGRCLQGVMELGL